VGPGPPCCRQPATAAYHIERERRRDYDANAERIKGSIRIEPNNFAEEIKTLPKDKDIYLYCT